MRVDDASYYRARALQEQVAAQQATCASARDRHDELAMMYRFKVAMLSRSPTWISEGLAEAETLASAQPFERQE